MVEPKNAGEPLIQVQNGGIQGAGGWQVRHVDLCVHAGKIVTLIGPNGSGKSTTVRMALGMLAPNEGTVHRKIGLRVGYVPQVLALDPTLPLTVKRFMKLMGPCAGAKDALERTGVAHLKDVEMQTLSGGQRQRVLFARAIAQKPELLVLDEPVQGVDTSGQTAIYNLIGSLRDETGCGVLLISHDLHIVMAATDHVVCLNGHVCCQGTPKAVAANESYQHLFGVSGESAIALYAHEHDHTHQPDGTVHHTSAERESIQ